MSSNEPKHNQARPRRHGVRLVQLFGGTLVAIAALLWVLFLRDLQPLVGGFELRWWWMVPAFALVEIMVVHLDVNREAQTISLSEIPLIFGMFFAAPAELVVSQFVGAGLALILYRRQSAMKVIFNLGQSALWAMVAIGVFRMLLPAGDPTGWQAWLAALAATMCADIASAALVSAAIGLLERWTMPSLTTFLGLGAVSTFANTALGLLGVALVRSDPVSAALIVVPVIVTYLAYVGFWREHRRGQHFEFLYNSMNRMTLASGLEDAITQLLEDSRAMFQSDVSAVILVSDDPREPARRSVLDADEHLEMLRPAHLAVPLIAEDGPLLLEAQYGRATRWLNLLGREVRDAIAIELRQDNRTIGAIVVADRAGDVNTFTRADLRFLETFGTHAVVALQNRYLERSVGELNQANTELAQRVLHDPLTRLANRTLFADRLDLALGRPSTDGSSVGVLFVDLDDFKRINDTYGHEAGDQVLIAVAERLRACIRPNDTAARMGGDEFTVVLESIQDEAEVEAVSQRILHALRVPVAIAGTEVQVNASIGQTISRRIPGIAAELMREADSAMYVAKSHGKGQWVAAPPAERATVATGASPGDTSV